MNMQVVDRMQASTVVREGQVMDSTQYWGDVHNLLEEKDKKIEEYAVKLKEEVSQHKYMKNSLNNVTPARPSALACASISDLKRATCVLRGPTRSSSERT